MRLPRFLPSALTVVFLATLFGACQQWRPQTLPPPGGSPAPQVLRLTMRDGSTVVLRRAVVFGDSVRGVTGGSEAAAQRDTVVALAQVQQAEAGRTNALRTGGLVVGAVVLALGAALAAAFTLTDWD